MNKTLSETKRLFGLQVRSFRKRHGWTQEDLAFTIGLDRTSISKIENGNQNSTIEVIVLLANVFKVPPYELLPDKMSFRAVDLPEKKRLKLEDLLNCIKPECLKLPHK